jgi:hypothetical protein
MTSAVAFWFWHARLVLAQCMMHGTCLAKPLICSFCRPKVKYFLPGQPCLFRREVTLNLEVWKFLEIKYVRNCNS